MTRQATVFEFETHEDQTVLDESETPDQEDSHDSEHECTQAILDCMPRLRSVEIDVSILLRGTQII